MRRVVGVITIIFFFSLSFYSEVSAQKVTILLADKSYEDFAFMEAIELYEFAYEKDTDNTYVIRRLADANRQVGNTEEAEKWLKILIDKRKEEPEDLFNYSQALKSNGKYLQAEECLEEYAELRPEDGRISMEASLLEYVRFLRSDSISYQVRPVSLNTEGSELGAAFYRDQVVFSSTKAGNRMIVRKYKWNDLPYLDLYIGDQAPNGDIINVKPFAPKLRTIYHDGPVAFDPTKDKVYITRNNVGKTGVNKGEEGEVNLKILFGGKEDGKWEYRGEFSFNSDDYSTGHPSIDQSGKVMYFASDMPGGYGGSDIYFSVFNDGFWSKPFNLGPKVNTSGNEFFPFISNDGVLYFASSGHGGMGGLDIFFSVPDGGIFNTVENMGYPINTSKDDFGLVLDETGKAGYFTSNRNGGRGSDDIYFVRIKCIPVIIRGVAKDKDTGHLLSNTKISIVNQFADTLFTSITGNDGQFEFEVNKGKDYIIKGQRDLYFTNEEVVETNKLHPNDEAFVELSLEMKAVDEDGYPEPIMMEEENGDPLQIIEMDYIDFDIGSWEIQSAAGKTIDQLIEFLLKYPDMEIRIESHTDSRGDDERNMLLSKRRAKAAFEYIISKEIEPLRVGYEGYGETRLLNECDNGVDCSEAQHAENNRTIVKVVKKGEYKGKRSQRNIFYF